MASWWFITPCRKNWVWRYARSSWFYLGSQLFMLTNYQYSHCFPGAEILQHHFARSLPNLIIFLPRIIPSPHITKSTDCPHPGAANATACPCLNAWILSFTWTFFHAFFQREQEHYYNKACWPFYHLNGAWTSVPMLRITDWLAQTNPQSGLPSSSSSSSSRPST